MKTELARFGLLGFIALGGVATAFAITDNSSTNGNPYAVISDRNVFRLNPPPPPPEPEQKPINLPKVMLSGFWTVGQTVKVLLAVPAADSKEPPTYLTLAAGEGGQNLEVVNIRAAKEEVDIINAGTPQTLTVASNGYAATAGAGHGGGGPAMPPLLGRHGMPMLPSAPPPAAAPASSGGSAIVIGGSSDTASSYGSPIVGGGSPGSSPYGGGGPGPGAAAQIANTLFSGTGGTVPQPPTEYRPPAPPEVQAALLLGNAAVGGPPAPVGDDGGDPPPSLQGGQQPRQQQ